MATDDLLSFAEAKTYVNSGTNDEQKADLLRAWITASSQLLAEKVGPVLYGTVTETHNGGGCHVYLKKSPVQSIVQVVEYDGLTAGTLTAESNTSKPAAGYYLDAVAGKITRRNDNTTDSFPRGMGNISVQYVAGRYATHGSITDTRFKTATGLILKNAWRAYEASVGLDNEFDVPQASFPRFAIPNAVKDMLGDEWRTGSGIGD
jgi:hypothetical protein